MESCAADLDRLLASRRLVIKGDQTVDRAALVEAERAKLAERLRLRTEAAKALQQPPRKFNQPLCSQRWIYKRAGGKQWLGYQDKVQQGLVNTR